MITLYWLISFFIILNIIDLIQTKFILGENGPDAEANLLARYLYRKGNFISLVIYKTVLISIAITFILISDSIGAVVTLIVIYIGAIFYNQYIIRTDTSWSWRAR